MVYADVPEHEGFADGDAPVREERPRIVSPTDEWLARISGQLQHLIDASSGPTKPTPARKAPAASKRTEVKGD